MLDNETKTRINTARDILVGKVPDPKSQVEQITIALIYKFMDDMDAEAEELGGARTFFTGEYEKYGWAKLMAPGRGGHEVLNLYAEAITKMTENAGIPLLFREIFKNAYLPYRDPETLKSFLKIIDDFNYDHSEKLGDAFEYLLSVLGSQGDAGQFRTPRHIIDFMVAVIDPKKNERILDPACGTAGFLISSYKYILAANAENGRSGAALTPDERTRLVNNVMGYDISPDMVRLSLVNLYLHGFSDPHIYEYDTLTSEERWNEYYDIIMANPPFMSPKGGIKPHKRFSVQSKRSEVLFVDYIAEHLSPNGRAAVIVPEGVIFQSGTAYKTLRKMLVNEYLVGVISLPAGVFNPYSGVKTSILWLDKALAKQNKQIAFVKVENDGFDLGAQRREVKGSDLPGALAAIMAYKASVVDGAEFDEEKYVALTMVDKTEIAENGDYNLSGERYKVVEDYVGNYPLVKIKDIGSVQSGYGFPKEKQGHMNKQYPFLKVSDMNLPGNETYIVSSNNSVSEEVLAELRAKSFPPNTVIFPKIGAAIATNKKRILTKESTFDNNVMGIVPDTERINPIYLFAILQSIDLSDWASDAQPPSMRKSTVEDYEIPLPPTAVQAEIVAEIESYQKIIDGARQVVENYRPRITIHPDWPLVELGEVCESILTGPFGSSLHQSDYITNGIPVINPQNIVDGVIIENEKKTISQTTWERLKDFAVRENDIIIARRGEMGRCAVIPKDMDGWLCGTGCFVIRLNGQSDPTFVFHQISSPQVSSYLEDQAVGVTMKNLNQTILSSVPIPLPSLTTQKNIVAEIEEEQALVQATRQLITRFEQKIKERIGQVWGEA